MDEKLKRYFEIKAEMAQLKREQDGLKDFFKTIVTEGNKVDFHGDEDLVRLQYKTRSNKRCDWTAFKTVNAQLYDELVTESSSTYMDIRKIVNG